MVREKRQKPKRRSGHNGGRPLGAKNKNTDQRIQQLLSEGESPLEYMLRVMRDEKVDTERRDKMAQGAAKFCHPTLQAITRKDGTDILPDFSNLSDEDLRSIANAKRLIARLLGTAVETSSGTGT